MPISRQSLTYGLIVGVASLLPACASTLPAQPVRPTSQILASAGRVPVPELQAGPVETTAGVEALRSACASDDGDACNNLAITLSEGLGVPQDMAGALFMFSNQCGRGNLIACRNAATVREVFLHEAKLPAGARPWPTVASR